MYVLSTSVDKKAKTQPKMIPKKANVKLHHLVGNYICIIMPEFQFLSQLNQTPLSAMAIVTRSQLKNKMPMCCNG